MEGCGKYGTGRSLIIGRPEYIGMTPKNRNPVFLVMEADHDVPLLDQPSRSGIVLSDLFRLVVRRPIDVNDCVGLPV